MKNKVLELYKNGMTNPYELAKECGFTIGTVRNYLYRAGLSGHRPEHNYKKRRPTQLSDLSDLTVKIMNALNDGKPVIEIAKEFYVTKQYVYKIKEKYLKNF